MAVEIRALGEADLAAAHRLAASSPEAAPWSESDFLGSLRHGGQGWIAPDTEGARVGFLVARETAGEAEILNLAVDPARRRQGIASALLQAALDGARQKGIAAVHLEVRASNRAAHQFYEAHGFRRAGSRRNYYRDPPEDAVLFSLSLNPESD